MAELLRQVLHPDDLVDRSANHRELQTLGYSDIAVDHLAEMKRDAEIERRFDGGLRQGAKAAPGFVGGGQRTATSLLG